MREMSVAVVKWDRLAAAAIVTDVTVALERSVVTVYNRAVAALDAMRKVPVDLAIVGLNFPDLDGIDLIAQLVATAPVRSILVVTRRTDEWARNQLRYSRINGFYDTATEEPSSFIKIVRMVADGQRYFSPSLALKATLSESRLHFLSTKELLVLSALSDSTDYHLIAEKLGISVKTLQTHKQNIMRKLKVHTRHELLREAIKIGLIVVRPTRTLHPGFEDSLPGFERRNF